jgi:hypothetical protein
MACPTAAKACRRSCRTRRHYSKHQLLKAALSRQARCYTERIDGGEGIMEGELRVGMQGGGTLWAEGGETD